MNLTELPQEKLREIKDRLTEDGLVVKHDGIKGYDAKFFETVTASNVLIKFFLFFSLGLYTLINLVGVILPIVFKSASIVNPLATCVGVLAVDFIISAIFYNVNTNKKKERSVIYVKGDNFIFNFSDGVSDTPKLFYSLPYDSVKKIEFLIYGLKKGELFGGVTFTFGVLDYEVTHVIRYTNLTQIKRLIEDKFPSLLGVLTVDGKNEKYSEPKHSKHLKYYLISLALLVPSALLIAIPLALNFVSIALIACGVILLISAVIALLSVFLNLTSLVQGAIVSGAFIIIGFCVPLFIIELSGLSPLDYILQNNEILMLTIFGIVGLCLFAYTLSIFIGKIRYALKRKQNIDI